MIRKVINFVLVVLIILGGLLPTKVYAEESNIGYVNKSDDENVIQLLNKIPVSQENPMPSNGSRISIDSWIEETKNYLENFHQKRIVKIAETDDEIIFEFEIIEGLIDQEQIYSVSYSKITSRALSTKIEVYTEDTGFNEVKTLQAQTWSIASNVIVGLAGLPNLFTGIISMITGLAISNLEMCTTFIDKIHRFIRTYRKVAFVYELNWTPRCIIEKRDYYYDHYFSYVGADKKPHSITTDYAFATSETKPHYDDDSWMKNKALEMQAQNNVYTDGYGY